MTAFTTRTLPDGPDTIAPDGSEVRVLAATDRGSMAHFRLAPAQVTRAVTHRTVEEIWFVVEGLGEMWRSRDGAETVTRLAPGVSLTIPLGTVFQFRAAAACARASEKLPTGSAPQRSAANGSVPSHAANRPRSWPAPRCPPQSWRCRTAPPGPSS